jgi:hypothetical protein
MYRIRNLLQQNEITRCLSRRTSRNNFCVLMLSHIRRSFSSFLVKRCDKTFVLASIVLSHGTCKLVNLLSEKSLFGVPRIRAEERTTNKRNKIENDLANCASNFLYEIMRSIFCFVQNQYIKEKDIYM